jgi:hypothetical protein
MIFYNRQVTHNAHLCENQDFNVLKITNLTFKPDICELTTEIFGRSQLIFFFRSHGRNTFKKILFYKVLSLN